MTNTEIDNDITYDLFISHYQKTGQQLAIIIKDQLLHENENLNIFLDIDDLNDIHDLKENIKKSENILLLITEDVFKRPFVIGELNTALKYDKNIITIWDKDRFPIFPQKEDICTDIKDIEKILNRKAITWVPDAMYRKVLIKEILKRMNLDNRLKIEEKDSFTSSFFVVTILGFYFVFEIKIYNKRKNNMKASFLWNYNKSDTLSYIEFELNDIKNYNTFGITAAIKGNNVKYIHGVEHFFTINEINNFTFKIKGILPVIIIDSTFKIDKHGKIEWIKKNNYNQGIYIESFDNTSIYCKMITKKH
jgi:hypothetical protein